MKNNRPESDTESLGGETVESRELSDPESLGGETVESRELSGTESKKSSFHSAVSQLESSIIVAKWQKLVEQIKKKTRSSR